MSLSLKDQLIAAGLVKPAEANKPAKPTSKPPFKPSFKSPARTDVSTRPQSNKPLPSKPPTEPRSSEPSLAELYRAREQQTQRELQAAKQQAEQKAREKRERKQAVLALIAGQALNQADAEHIRHFEYARKIRRIYLSSEQRELLNNGTLGIVQMDGKFILLPVAIVEAVQSKAPEFVALFGASAEAEPPADDPNYSDPKFQVPDDLTW